MSALLEIQHLKKYFDTARGSLHAVDDVSLAIEEGRTVGVVGESGCGKSTLGRTIIHLLDSTDGKILFRGEDVTDARGRKLRKLREDMQIIFQDPFSSLNPRLTVIETVSEALLLSKRYGAREVERETLRLMDMVGVESRLRNAYPHEMDGGRRQRVGIARALALSPKFVVCDEPVSALDVSIQAQILNLLQDLQEELKLTLLFITHDLSVVRHISNEICVMYLGEIVERAEAKELFRRPLHPYTRALLSAIPSTDILHPRRRMLLKGEIASPINPKPGCRFAVRCPHAGEQCGEKQRLEEIESGHFVACSRVREIDGV